jgi:hypothetical protein
MGWWREFFFGQSLSVLEASEAITRLSTVEQQARVQALAEARAAEAAVNPPLVSSSRPHVRMPNGRLVTVELWELYNNKEMG